MAGAAFLMMSVAVSLARGSHAVQGWSGSGVSGINLHVRQAAAFLRGETALDGPGLDTASFRGRFYVPFPPGPALLFLPIVAMLGERPFIATGVSLLLTLLNIAVLVSILKRLDVPRTLHFWLVLAFFFGSGYWYVLSFSEGVWFSASVVGVTALLLAIRESLIGRRGWVIGACLGLAFLSRQMTLLAAPFVVLSAWERSPRPTGQARVAWWISLAAPMLAAAVFLLAFNEIRFGNIWDSGYSHLTLDGYELVRRERYGLFSLAYVPVNLYHLLVHGFSIGFVSPDGLSGPQPDWFGTSLPAASPFVLLAFFGGGTALRARALWATLCIMLFAQSLYYVNGAGQLNWPRYALDYWPLLFILVACGLRSEALGGRSTLWKAAIAYAVVLNALMLAYFDVFASFLRAWSGLFARPTGLP